MKYKKNTRIGGFSWNNLELHSTEKSINQWIRKYWASNRSRNAVFFFFSGNYFDQNEVNNTFWRYSQTLFQHKMQCQKVTGFPKPVDSSTWNLQKLQSIRMKDRHMDTWKNGWMELSDNMLLTKDNKYKYFPHYFLSACRYGKPSITLPICVVYHW